MFDLLCKLFSAIIEIKSFVQRCFGFPRQPPTWTSSELGQQKIREREARKQRQP